MHHYLPFVLALLLFFALIVTCPVTCSVTISYCFVLLIPISFDCFAVNLLAKPKNRAKPSSLLNLYERFSQVSILLKVLLG